MELSRQDQRPDGSRPNSKTEVRTIGGEIPTEGMSKRLNPGEEPGAHSKKRNPMARVGSMAGRQNLASFLMAAGQGDWLTGQSIMMNALATGGNFHELRDGSDAGWVQDRARIEAQKK